MNQQIQNLDYNKLLFLDIETVRGIESFDSENTLYDIWAWKQRNRETNDLPEEKEIIQSYYDKAALYPEWGKIACISVGVISNDNIVVKSYTGGEKDILKAVVEMIISSGRKLVGHNIIGFDLPYIRRRFFINGLTDYLNEAQGNDTGSKPWILSERLIDTMDLWKGTSYYNTSLEELAMCFGISAKSKLHGNEVSDYFYNGKLQDVINYCQEDVGVVANILRCWKGDSVLSVVSKEETIKPLPLLERILAAGAITKETAKEIKEIASKMTPEEKQMGLTVVTCALGTSKKKLDKEVVSLFQ